MVRDTRELFKELEEMSNAIEQARELLEDVSRAYDRIYSFIEENMPEVE